MIDGVGSPQLQEFCRPHSQSWGHKGSIFQRIPQEQGLRCLRGPELLWMTPRGHSWTKSTAEEAARGEKTWNAPPGSAPNPSRGHRGRAPTATPLGINPGNLGCAPRLIPGSAEVSRIPKFPNSRVPEFPEFLNSRTPEFP